MTLFHWALINPTLCGLQSPQYANACNCQPLSLNLAAQNTLHLKASLQPPQCLHLSVIIQPVKVIVKCLWI